MASAIDVTKPVYGNPTTQSVRDNFSAAHDEIGQLQIDVANRVAKSGDTMTGFLTLFDDPQLALHATTQRWVINQIRSSANAAIYVGDYDAAADRVLTSGQASIPVGSPLPAASTGNTQFYFTVKTGKNPPSIGNQPPGGVPVGSWLLSNGVNWNVFQPSAAGIVAQSVPVNPSIVGLPGTDVYAALSSVPALYLPLTGGTISGNLSLANNPTLNGHAATKAYVDSRTPTVTMPTYTGIIIDDLIGNNKEIIGQSAGVKHWQINLGNTNIGGFANDFSISRFDDSGNILDTNTGSNIFAIARTNGSVLIRGNLYLAPDVGVRTSLIGRQNVPTDPLNDQLVISPGGLGTGAGNTWLSLRGPTFNPPNSIAMYAQSSSWLFDTAGWINVNAVSAGVRFASGGFIQGGTDNSLIMQRATGYRLVIGSDGSFHYQGNGNNTSCFYSTPDTFWHNGNSTSPNGKMSSQGWYSTNNTQFQLNGYSTENNLTWWSGSTVYLYARSSDWNMGFIRGSAGENQTWRYSDGAIICWGAGGYYAYGFLNLSDEQLKHDIKPARECGLQEILGINPISYVPRTDIHASRKPQHKLPRDTTMSPEEELESQRMLADMKTKEWEPLETIGFSAQQVQKVFPQAVSPVERDEPDSMLCIGVMPLLAALVNAVKELHARIPQ